MSPVSSNSRLQARGEGPRQDHASGQGREATGDSVSLWNELEEPLVQYVIENM